MVDISFFAALAAGLVTFFAPCTFVTLPYFIGYIGGVALEEESESINYRAFKGSIPYVLGFMIVFTLMGTTASFVGSFIRDNRDILVQVSSFILIGLGVLMVFGEKIPYLAFTYKEQKFEVKRPEKSNRFTSFLLGITSAFAWTPCIGPILGGILLLAGNSDTVVEGTFLLFTYSLGIGIPFLLIALMIDKVKKYIFRSAAFVKKLHKITGWILIIVGIGYLTGLNNDIYRLYNSTVYQHLPESLQH